MATENFHQPEFYDVIILGGGPAGIGCALELHELRANYLLIDRNERLGGQLPEVQNTIRNFAARYWQSGTDLRDDMEALCQKIGIATKLSESISRIELSDKTLYGANKNYIGKAIFLATGTRPRMLSIEGAGRVKENIILYVEQNESLLSGKKVAVVGGGDNALMDSLWLAQRCPSVLLIHRSGKFKARADVIADVQKNSVIKIIDQTQITSLIEENGKLKKITMQNNVTKTIETREIDYLVVRAGFAPNNELFSEQLKADKDGFVIVDELCRTSIKGIFAGGDLVAPACQGIARSVGHGLVAARSIYNFIVNQVD